MWISQIEGKTNRQTDRFSEEVFYDKSDGFSSDGWRAICRSKELNKDEWRGEKRREKKRTRTTHFS
jgi:hypothetical protein